MPLTAYDGERQYQAPFIADEDWLELKKLKLTLICGTRGIPRRSKLGTKHFYHYDLAACDFEHKPESPEHLRIKTVVMLAAREAEWEANEEVRAPDGSWIADVMATRGDRQYAFEVQWSKQIHSVYQARQDRYAKDGVECLWLVRHIKYLTDGVTAALGVAIVDDDPVVRDGTWTPSTPGTPEIPLAPVIIAVLNSQLRWAPARRGTIAASTRWGVQACNSCGAHSITFHSVGRAEKACELCEGTWTEGKDLPDAVSAGDLNLDLPQASLAVPESPSHPGDPTDLAWGFSCPGCAARFAWLDQAWLADAAEIRTDERDTELPAHWCHPGWRGSTIQHVLEALRHPPAPLSARAAGPRSPVADAEVRHAQSGRFAPVISKATWSARVESMQSWVWMLAYHQRRALAEVAEQIKADAKAAAQVEALRVIREEDAAAQARSAERLSNLAAIRKERERVVARERLEGGSVRAIPVDAEGRAMITDPSRAADLKAYQERLAREWLLPRVVRPPTPTPTATDTARDGDGDDGS
ncbi:competence protein CoiA family protein [Cryobacterium sp. CG_9.6]|uniref:competence protein CoiA n=1 Tax=Cryobacterium sp. CG_9.6 TaxID=2760710 RepID=UPI00247457C1|nr:competence protein CoiA family protein [Cryobacterium sp. CG_9.6]MDH6238230.1 hypothetical protein [Cryobacterium sp. CG_9.6]